MRYTAKRLDEDVDALNVELAETGSDNRFLTGGRNGYTTIDIQTVKQAASGSGCVQRMLVGGTPRECLAECQNEMLTEYQKQASDFLEKNELKLT